MKKLMIFTLVITSLLMSSSIVLALGTGAGVSITNRATVYYNVAGLTQPAIESSPTGNTTGTGTDTTFAVDTKIDLLVAAVDAAAVTIAPSGMAYATYNTVNLGNATQDIALTEVDVVDGTANPFGGALVDTFDSDTAVVLYEETNGTAGLQTGVGGDTAVTALDNVAPSTDGSDNARKVYLVITAPVAGAGAGEVEQDDLAVYALRATALTIAGGALANDASPDIAAGSEIVFADGTGSDDTTGNYDAEHSARSAFVVSTATLSIAKTVAVYDTGNSLPTDTYAIPGAIVIYTITVTNTGASDATNVVIQDAIPANTTFATGDVSAPITHDVTGGTATFSNNSGTSYAYTPTFTNGVDTAVTNVQIDMGTVVATTGSKTATFKVKIN